MFLTHIASSGQGSHVPMKILSFASVCRHLTEERKFVLSRSDTVLGFRFVLISNTDTNSTKNEIRFDKYFVKYRD